MTKIKNALISVYQKDGLDKIAQKLNELNITIYSTGGTQSFIENLDILVKSVESLTSYPSILGGRVKTLHPNVFGGILAKREADHLETLAKYDIPEIDLVIVDLYPFEDTVQSTNDEGEIIEKIDIGGISLIRAAAKNFNDVLVVPSQNEYAPLMDLLEEKNGLSSKEDRKMFAAKAFQISSHYDTMIFNYFNSTCEIDVHKSSFQQSTALRYGENPHQTASFYGNLEDSFVQLSGKSLSYNNLVDIDAAINLMSEFSSSAPTFAILKHTNACGIASRETILQAWYDALAGDPVSAFGGILISNTEIDLALAQQIDTIFYEVVLAPSFSEDAYQHLSKKKKRVLLKLEEIAIPIRTFKTLLNGVIGQEMDISIEDNKSFDLTTNKSPSPSELQDLVFANKCAKHLKSNTIVLVKNKQLLGMGCGQTSRVDACNQAIDKASRMGFELTGAVLASDAFFPFPDNVELAWNAGIRAVIQPGGSIKDQLSIDFCNEHDVAMVFTGVRHFKH